MKLTYRLAKYSLLILVLLIILIVSGLTYIVTTSSGTQLALSYIPGLTVEDSQGSLSGGWSAKRLTWQNDSSKITITQPTFLWHARCLFKAHVCIKQLTVKQIAIDLAEQTKQVKQPNDTPTTLPTIKLPLKITVGKLSVDTIILNQQAIIKHLALSHLHIQKSQLSFEKLAASYQRQLNAELTGSLSLANNWPLTLHGQLNLEPLLSQPWSTHFSATGELQKQLNLSVNSQGFLNAQLTAKTAVLDKNLPTELMLNIKDFSPHALANIPKTLAIKQLELTAKGDLQQGYTLQNNATLVGHTTPVKLSLTGQATAEDLTIESLRLSTSKQQFVTLTAQVGWINDLKAKGKLNFQNFPWVELYPLASSPPINLNTLQGNFNYQSTNYRANLQGKLTGPAGIFAVNTEIQGDQQQLTINKLLVNTADKGHITGKGKLTFAPAINWLADIKLQSINPNYWLTNISGNLQGHIQTQGTLHNKQLTSQNNILINGILQKQKTLIKTRIISQAEQWKIPELLMQLGSNQIKGHGQLDKRLQAQLNINLPTLKQISPNLTGQLKGQLSLTGSLEKPQGNLTLIGQSLGFDSHHLKQLNLTANLNQQQQGQLTLQANHIKSADLLLGNLSINGSGDLKKQQTSIKLTDGLIKFISQMNSQQDKQHNWNIAIHQLHMGTKDQNWQLQKTAQLHYTSKGTLTLNEHCLENGKATLCGIGQQKILPNTLLNYQLANFPTQSLTPWLPENFNWQSILSATINLDISEQKRTGRIHMNANNGTFKLRERTEDEWQSFNYKDLNLNVNLTPNKVTSLLKFTSTPLGHIDANININPLTQHKALTGHFKIADFDLSVLQPLIPQLDKLTGKINGAGTIKGNLNKPYIAGKISINDGNISGDIPVNIEKLQLNAMVEGEKLQLNGNWRSGDKGYGSIQGAVNWRKALNANLTLKAYQLPIIVAPYAKLIANSDLNLKMQNNSLFAKGIIQIPKGEIKIRELPPSTIKVSSDAVIVQKQIPPPPQTPLKLNMDINVLIGKERLKFSGFGLTSDVTGNLKISDDLLTHGNVNLIDGQFRAYGQRLEVRRARIMFTGSLTEPALDIEAVREVDDVTAGLKVTGLTSQPKVTIFSTPNMSQDQALSYIILGRPMDAGDDNMLARAALVLGVAGGSPLVGDLASKIGIQDFQLDTAGSGDNTSVVASGNLTDKLSVHYGMSIFQSVNTLMVRYKLTKTLSLEAASGLASSLDLFYKKSF